MSETQLPLIEVNLNNSYLEHDALANNLGEISAAGMSSADKNLEPGEFASAFQTNLIVPEAGTQLKINFETVCRFCLVENEYMIDITDVEAVILEMVKSLAKIQIDLDDILPKRICSTCFETLTKLFIFTQQIKETDKTLRSCIVLHEVNYSLEPYDAEDEHQEIKYSDTVRDKVDGENSESLENVAMFDELIEEDYDSNYVMVYETEPLVYSNYATEDESSLAENNLKVSDMKPIPLVSDQSNTGSAENPENPTKSEIGLSEENNSSEPGKSPENRDRKHICPICRKSYSYSTNLQCHMACHQNEVKDQPKNIKCTKCNASFAVEKDLFIHESIHTESDTFQCRECLKVFPHLPKLKRHVKTHYEDKPVKCEVCGHGFPEMASLTRHYRVHTKVPRERKHVCKECGKAYYDSHSLSIHLRTHTGEKPWACTKCDKRFTDSRLLSSHMKTHTKIRMHSCTVCDKTFTHRSTLVSHMCTHTGEKPFVCKICNKSFIQSSNLILHLRVHTGEKPYKCTKCPKAFGSSSTLALHNRTHTGEKPYSCEICGKSFARHNLTIHMRTHTGEKPFKCSECSRRFTSTSHLAQHMRSHTGERPYSCEICGKKWTTHSNLKKHMQIHLNRIEPQIEEANDEMTMGTEIQEKNDPYDQQKHRIRIEEIRSDAEFNENALLVNDLLASVVNVNADILQSGNVEIPELSSYDSNSDLGEFRNVMNSSRFESSRSNETSGERVFVTEA